MPRCDAMTTPSLLLVLMAACGPSSEPKLQRSHIAEEAAYNCELLAMASDWYCIPEDRVIPLSCSWGREDAWGIVTVEGSTGCVTTTCEDVLYWVERECYSNQNGEAVLRADNTAECCTEESCGTEFGCF